MSEHETTCLRRMPTGIDAVISCASNPVSLFGKNTTNLYLSAQTERIVRVGPPRRRARESRCAVAAFPDFRLSRTGGNEAPMQFSLYSGQ